MDRDADRRKIAESVEQSTADLRAVIARWGERVEIERFLTGVEQRAAALPLDEQALMRQRLALARTFLGTQDPLDFIRNWKTPDELYRPRFPQSQ